MELTLEQFLKELVELMKQDFPHHFRRMIEVTEGLVWLQTLDEEKTLIRVTADDVVIGCETVPKLIDVRINLSRKCLFDLLEGRITLDKALQENGVEAFGKPATLLKCYRVFEQILLLSRLSPRFYFLTYKLQ
jgi:hypothetical protein